MSMVYSCLLQTKHAQYYYLHILELPITGVASHAMVLLAFQLKGAGKSQCVLA
jgi:hypothetical protein